MYDVLATLRNHKGFESEYYSVYMGPLWESNSIWRLFFWLIEFRRLPNIFADNYLPLRIAISLEFTLLMSRRERPEERGMDWAVVNRVRKLAAVRILSSYSHGSNNLRCSFASDPARKEVLLFELSIRCPMKFVGLLLKRTLVPAEDRGVIAICR
jgi:hypothetical protein